MKRGPKPLPRNLRLVLGTETRKDRERPAKPVEELPVKIPSPPEYLNAEETETFLVTARKLASMRVMTEADVELLAMYSRAWVEWKDASRRVQEMGLMVRNPHYEPPKNIPMLNPFLSIRDKAEAKCKAIMLEFGMSPSSRNRVSQ